MSYIIMADRDQDEAAWFHARELGVTATDAATLIRGGAGAWSAIRAAKNGVRNDFKSRPMAWGIEREPDIAEYARTTYDLIPTSAVLADPLHPQYLASPDAISMDGTEVGEYKTTIHDWLSWADVPPRYRDQMLWQMFVTGARKAKLVFEPHDDYNPIYPFPRMFELEYDEARVSELVAVADKFLAGGGDFSEDDFKIDALLTARIEAKDIADKAADEVARLDELIRDQVDNEPTRFEGSLGLLTLSADSVSERFDSVAFKNADPDLWGKFVKPSHVKGRLTITARKES